LLLLLLENIGAFGVVCAPAAAMLIFLEVKVRFVFIKAAALKKMRRDTKAPLSLSLSLCDDML